MRSITFFLILASGLHAQDPRDLERRMADLVNQDRARAGLPPLRFSDKLATVARGHSQDMADAGFFQHQSPTTGDHGARLHRAGVPAAKSGENIARDASIDLAEIHLMQSPGHRANILSSEFTHVGIGIVRQGGQLFVTQNFVRPIPRVDPAFAVKKMTALINEKRAHARLPPLKLDPRLNAVCQRAANAMNARQKLASAAVSAELKKANLRYYMLQVWVGLSPEPGKVLDAEFLTDDEINALGVGIAINQTRDNGLGNLWIALVVADLP